MSLFSCVKDESLPSLYNAEDSFDAMVADFEIVVLDSANGEIMLIDHCENVSEIIWKGVFGSEWLNIPDTYPGDTILLTLETPAEYVFYMEAYGDYYNDNPDVAGNTLIKTKVHTFTLADELASDSVFVPYLRSVSLTNYPLRDDYGFLWDNDSLPDIGIEISYAAFDEYNNYLVADTTFDNVERNKLPVSLTLDLGHRIDDIRLSFILYDYDNVRENANGRERMISETFYLSEQAPEPVVWWETFEDLNWYTRSTSSGIKTYEGKYLSIEVEWR